MSLLEFTAKVQQGIIFDPKFTGIKARYLRRVEDGEGELSENKCAILYVSTQGNYGVADKRREEFDARITVLWAKTEDLKFDGEPFLPMEGDIIEYKINGVLHQYRVTRNPSTTINIGSGSVFAYEDGLHRIIKIMTVKQK